jgi:CubicO group peptidase (beta-lactamase class C family)
MPARFFSLLCVFTLVVLLLAISPVTAQSEEVEVLGETFDALIPSLLEQYDIPGAAIAIIHDGELAWSAGYGVADLDTDAPVTPDTPFHAASIAKVMTAWAAMGLVEAGELDLDAPITSYITRWELPLGRYRAEDVTARRLLSHTAGTVPEGYHGFEPDAELPTLEAFLTDSPDGGVSVILPPGVTFSYSGGGYQVMQLALEEITGQAFGDYMEAAVFEPLALANSSFMWSPEVATNYFTNGQRETGVIHLDQAAGGLYTSVNDLATFLTSLLSNKDESPGRGLLAPESVEAIFTPAEATDDEYGFGVYVDTRANQPRLIWHDGIGNARSLFALLPDSGEGLIIMTNKFSGVQMFGAVRCAWDEWLEEDLSAWCRGL